MKEKTYLRESGLARAVETMSPRCRNKVVRRKMGASCLPRHPPQRAGARCPQTQGPGMPSPRQQSLVPMDRWEQRRGPVTGAQVGPAGLSGTIPSTQFPGPHQVSPLSASGGGHCFLYAQHAATKLWARDGNQTSAGGSLGISLPSLLIQALSPRLSPTEPGSLEAGPAQRPLPGQSMGIRAADRGRDAANPWAGEVTRQDMESMLFH